MKSFLLIESIPPIKSILLSIGLFATISSYIAAPAAEVNSVENISSWRELKPSQRFKQVDGLHYFEFKTANGSNAYLVVADLHHHNLLLKPVVNKSTATTTATARGTKAVASVNGAFFNLSNGESTSYITVAGVKVCDPTQNRALTENPKLKPFLETIYNRSELRILKTNKGATELSIAPHDSPIAQSQTLIHSIQAGPRLLPTLTGKEEAFVRTEADGKIVDSIGVNKPAARTAIGITKDGEQVMLVCVASKRQDEFSSGLTLAELATLMKGLGCVEALNLDGGTSTTMAVQAENDSYQMVCGREPETLVKSTLSLFKN
jgi:Phosphodiester glycosidase